MESIPKSTIKDEPLISESINPDMFKFYTSQHEFEVKRNDSLNDNISKTIAVMVVIGGVASYFVSNYPTEELTIRSLFVIFLLMAALLGVYSIFNICRALWNTKMWHLPRANEIRDYERTIEKFLLDNPGIANSKNQYIDIFLLNGVCDAASKNNEFNNEKAAFLFKAKRSQILAAICIFIAAFPFYIYLFNKPSNAVQQVKIMNPVFLENSMNSSNQQKPAPTPPPKPPSPPPGPPNRLIKEGSPRPK
jgi:hypothetical protein